MFIIMFIVKQNGYVMTPIEKAIIAGGGGSITRLAKALGVSPQLIGMIKFRGGRLTTRKIPIQKWVEVTGLPEQELFPNLYKKESN